jgi:Protein of unknown function (DUF3999)
MKIIRAGIGFIALFAAGISEPAISYFTRVRELTITAPDRQNYLLVDQSIWNHARADLGDLRVYDGSNQVPYELVAQRGETSTQEADVRIFNLARHGDHTEFDLDVSPVTEYNRIRLVLDHKDFLVSANVEGRDALAGAAIAVWPNSSTLFDFSRENLGANSTIGLPAWSFRYLHVRLSRGILPGQVRRAMVSHMEERKSHWTSVGSCQRSERQPRRTVIHCEVPARMPVERIRFDVASSEVNFRRTVMVADNEGLQLGQGTITRVRISRGGTVALTENLALSIFGEHRAELVVTVENEDNSPLRFDAVQPEALERRVYFDPQGRTNLKLYYGDEKLAGPVYDYAKFFHEEPNAAHADLGPDMANAAYAGRPDNRPWSERHKAVLWLAMLVAVAVLATLAIRGLGAKPGSTV